MKTSLSAYALALGLLAAGPLTAVHAQDVAQSQFSNQQASSVNAETQSDLADWRAAGFDAQTYDALSHDVFGAAYQQRYAKYQELRKLHSPANQQAATATEHASSATVNGQSDLADWRAAGFDAQTYNALSQDVFSPAYQQRYAKYQALRKLHSQQAA